MFACPRMVAASAVLLAATATTAVSQQGKTPAKQPAAAVTVDVSRITDKGVETKIGTVEIRETKAGLSFKVAVKGIAKGQHGFHVHEKGNCGAAMKDGKMAAGVAAGTHLDPAKTGAHKGPQGKGHLGDLPALTSNGQDINQTVVAPRLKLADVRGRALMIHEGGDTYSDNPKDGGGNARIACGVVPAG